MSKFKKGIDESDDYAANTTTGFAYIGLFLFGFMGIGMMIHACIGLFATFWMYYVENSSIASAGKSFLLATVSFLISLLFIKAFGYCRYKLKQYQLPN